MTDERGQSVSEARLFTIEDVFHLKKVYGMREGTVVVTLANHAAERGAAATITRPDGSTLGLVVSIVKQHPKGAEGGATSIMFDGHHEIPRGSSLILKRMPSDFSEALRRLLDDTQLFDRGEWATYLGVKKDRIEKWLADAELPRVGHLGLILTTIENSDVPPGPLLDFTIMAGRPAREVSPHGRLMLPTVMEFVKRPAFCDLSNKLAKLDDAGKADLLESLYPEPKEP